MSIIGMARTTAALALSATVLLGGPLAVAAESEGGSVLHVFNWSDYIDPQVVEDFELEYAIDVVIETFDDENEMISVIQADTAAYDLIFTSDSTVFEMAEQRLLAELDHDHIPNLANIDPAFLDLPNDPGNRYSVPYDLSLIHISEPTRR